MPLAGTASPFLFVFWLISMPSKSCAYSFSPCNLFKKFLIVVSSWATLPRKHVPKTLSCVGRKIELEFPFASQQLKNLHGPFLVPERPLCAMKQSFFPRGREFTPFWDLSQAGSWIIPSPLAPSAFRKLQCRFTEKLALPTAQKELAGQTLLYFFFSFFLLFILFLCFFNYFIPSCLPLPPSPLPPFLPSLSFFSSYHQTQLSHDSPFGYTKYCFLFIQSTLRHTYYVSSTGIKEIKVTFLDLVKFCTVYRVLNSMARKCEKYHECWIF